MGSGETIAANVAERLGETVPELVGHVTPRNEDGRVYVEVDAVVDGSMLELRPPVTVREVPVWVELKHGRADLTDVDFEPVAVSVVSWGEEHAQRGLLVGFPQMLLSPALAGQRRNVPVAGGRRGDGALELWIEPGPGGEVLAAVDADARLGQLAELSWTAAAGGGRLLVALAGSQPGRRTGLAALPEIGEQLLEIDLLVHEGLGDAAVDDELLQASVAAARSQAARELWGRLTGPLA